MTEKSGNEIHEAYMKGYFQGKDEILDELKMLIGAKDNEFKRQKEAQE